MSEIEKVEFLAKSKDNHSYMGVVEVVEITIENIVAAIKAYFQNVNGENWSRYNYVPIEYRKVGAPAYDWKAIKKSC